MKLEFRKQLCLAVSLVAMFACGAAEKFEAAVWRGETAYVEIPKEFQDEAASFCEQANSDDVKFELNGRDAKIFASQGQQRSIVLALKIAEMQVFENELGEKPVLVLDDVFSELDSARQKKMYEKLKGVQVLMTGTAFKFKPDEDYLTLQVKSAKIKSKFNQKIEK